MTTWMSPIEPPISTTECDDSSVHGCVGACVRTRSGARAPAIRCEATLGGDNCPDGAAPVPSCTVMGCSCTLTAVSRGCSCTVTAVSRGCSCTITAVSRGCSCTVTVVSRGCSCTVTAVSRGFSCTVTAVRRGQLTRQHSHVSKSIAGSRVSTVTSVSRLPALGSVQSRQ